MGRQRIPGRSDGLQRRMGRGRTALHVLSVILRAPRENRRSGCLMPIDSPPPLHALHDTPAAARSGWRTDRSSRATCTWGLRRSSRRRRGGLPQSVECRTLYPCGRHHRHVAAAFTLALARVAQPLRQLRARCPNTARVVFIPGKPRRARPALHRTELRGVEVVHEAIHHAAADGRRYLSRTATRPTWSSGTRLVSMIGGTAYDGLVVANRWANRLRAKSAPRGRSRSPSR